MKTYNSFMEEISPQRLAQLKAKGKGGAAAAQMKADGTKPGKPKGGALATRPKSGFVKQQAGQLARSAGSSLARKAVDKGGELIRTNFKKPDRKPQPYRDDAPAAAYRKPKDRGLKKKIGNFMGSGIKRALQSPEKENTGVSNSNLKGSGTTSWGNSMK